MTCAMSHTSALSCPRIMHGKDILVRPLVFLLHGESKHMTTSVEVSEPSAEVGTRCCEVLLCTLSGLWKGALLAGRIWTVLVFLYSPW